MKKTQKQKTGDGFSKYIRLKYASSSGYCSCYTCGIVKPGKQMQAGHGIGGRTNRILFNEDIVRTQCGGCNIYAYGKLDEFGDKLCKEIGTAKYKRILRDKHIPLKRTEQQLIDLELEFKTKAKLLAEEKGQQL